MPVIQDPEVITGMFVRRRIGERRLKPSSELASLKKMATVGCRQAERLLWAYVEALGDSSRAYKDYIQAIRTGPTGSIKAMEKVVKDELDDVRSARRAFEEHAREHGCRG